MHQLIPRLNFCYSSMNILFYLFCAVVTKKRGILNKYTLRSVKSDDQIDIEIFFWKAQAYIFPYFFDLTNKVIECTKFLKRKLYSHDSHIYFHYLDISDSNNSRQSVGGLTSWHFQSWVNDTIYSCTKTLKLNVCLY